MRAAVLGQPIAHSRSPVLHNAAYQALGLHDWSYTSIECDEAGLPGLIGSLGPDWAGLSLTMPLKRAVLPLLDVVDPLVTAVGGANTVVFRPGGRHGYNTDVPGMVAALADLGVVTPGVVPAAAVAPGMAPGVAPGAGVAPASALEGATILGAGATACAALAAVRELGLTSAVVLARSPSRAGDLRDAALRLGVAIELRPFAAGVRDGDLLISTLPGTADVAWPPVTSLRAVLDVVYHPWPTPLAAAALRAGVPVAGGFDLLLHQAARQVELMTGRAPAPLAEMRAALTAASR
ncbi:MAG TPA: shikimate dehydrogenase [Streptosporangiaceae bacterium]|nr:shikimate dehydrogenase [Streptosporangiaceae bacterium]